MAEITVLWKITIWLFQGFGACNEIVLALQVYYCKEDEVCLYQSLLFEVPFQEEVPESKPAEIKFVYDVKPKTPTSSLQLVAP